MDDRIFDQLDRLERGSRVEMHPTRNAYHNSSADYSAYDEMRHDEEPTHHREWHPDEYGIEDQPLTLDSFDERLLRQADQHSRHGQATLGRGRLSLPPANAYPQAPGFDPHAPTRYPQEDTGQRFDLSQFALNQEQHAQSTSSPMEQLLPSSPTFNVSQRRPAPSEYLQQIPRRPTRDRDRNFAQHLRHQPSSAEHFEAGPHGMPSQQTGVPGDFEPNWQVSPLQPTANLSNRGPPVVQGINLVSTHTLPDRLRAIFPYPLFNAVQSKCFETIFSTNNNFVLAAPTGSGKTAVLELAVCRLISTFASDTYKIVYQAPTKSLCAERQRDWQAKFGPLGLQCAELTGDTANAHLRNVQQASIIITTPEKWDSTTRKWKDHQRLMQMVKLFLIDEVHILKEDRGATLEAVVSRMKSVGSDVRFVVLSATVPNSEDIATWLGKDPMNPQTPASRERFGEEFRPVRLRKHVAGYQASPNDFAFDKMLNGKLPEVITKWSQRKPIMVFCFTRNSCVETAKLLANWWSTKGPKERYWTSPRKRLVVAEKDLRETVSSGVAFHHAGLAIQDRNVVEKAYLEGDVNVICCTSTLAVGVNLPCHMVIIKNTVTYQQAGGCKEYSDLEIMQMLGRAGRPQFDDSAIAVIMTRMQRVPYYEKMISGQEILESCLHRNLIDHLNAEIGLGTITSVSSAKKWLSGTFLYVRLKDNPEHYKIDGDAPGRSIDERLEKTCSNSIAVLEEYDLVSATPKLRCTEFGDAMARYYLQFETMKVIMALPPHSKVSEILSAISQAAEFREVRFRAGEKPVYKDLNKNTSIKFPIPVNLDLPPHKVSLVIQSVLGAIDLPTEDHKHRVEYNSAKATIFQHATRLIRCIVDCQLYLEDAVTTRNALMLARSIGAQVWDDSPLHMKQLDGVGLVYVRKLATAGITSVEELENVEAHRIEQAVSRNPPFGSQVQTRAKAFPKLRISIKMVGEPDIKKGEHANIRLKADIGFLNETVPEVFQRRPIYVCLLAETSDGHKVHFARISAKKLSKGQDVLFSAILTDASQSVRAYVMCDEIAGTMRHAMLNPAISPSVFPPPKIDSNSKDQQAAATPANKGKRRSTTTTSKNAKDDESDEFADPDLDDADFARAEANGFINIDDFDDDNKGEPQRKRRKTDDHQTLDEDWEPQQLANGKWACNHRCGNKSTCKHMCCREGLDKKPKPPKAKDNKKDGNERGSDPKQTQLNIGVTKKTSASTQAQPSIEEHPSTKSKPTSAVKVKPRVSDSKEARDLDRLHNSVKTKTPNVPTLGSSRATDKAARTSGKTRQPRLSFLEAARAAEEDDGSDYGLNDEWSSNDLPDMNAIVGTQPTSRMSPPRTQAGLSGDGDDAFGAMDFDVEDEDPFQTAMGDHDNDQVDFSSFVNGLGIVGNDDTEIFDHSVHDAVDTQPAGPIGGVERHNTEPDRNNQHLFVGYSSEPPAKYASPSYVNTTQRRSIPAPLVKTTGSNDNAAAQLVHSVETSNQGAQEVAAPPQAAEKKEDDAYEWFYATFGKEHFNIVS